MDDIDLHYDHVAALRGRYLEPCDCHLLPRTSDDGEHSDLPDPACAKCHGEGELYAREET
jgi:hypothetical protein